MSNDVKQNVYYMIEMSVRHSHSLLKLLLESIENSYRGSIEKFTNDVHCDLMLLLLAANNEMYRDEV